MPASGSVRNDLNQPESGDGSQPESNPAPHGASSPRPSKRKVILRNLVIVITGIILFVFLRTGCGSGKLIADFESDGCSLFIDRSIILQKDWCECCFEHDIAYWKGGTEEQRIAADKALRDCVQNKTGNKELAELMYNGVRFGGSPYFYNWYRWGYGWNYQRKYQPHSDAELLQIDEKLRIYFAGKPDLPCSDSE